MSDCIITLVTAGSREEADRIAEALVLEELAACVNVVGPIRSVYRWEGRIQRDDEWLLVIKTRNALFDALTARIKSLHSYQTPEVIALPIVAGAADYLDWLRSVTPRRP